ncbi:MAG: excinuclease ABC subunit UvrC, partial [Candidatus Omnitrophota bacterium]
KKLPDSAGVYMFLDARGRVIYVGKSRQLRKRVASYFQRGRAGDNRHELLVSEVRNIKFVKTSSEAEALIYEAGLIKDYSPKFNIELKDDKSYPFLKLTAGEKYPRLLITRRKSTGDGALYYGPYVNVKLLKEALSFMKRMFPLRTCRRLRKSVCLEYHVGQCLGPCEKKATDKEYDETVGQLKQFLEGRKDDLIRTLEKQMKRFSHVQRYEKALFIKKRIEALTAVRQFHDRSRHPMYGELDELQNALGLPTQPLTVECFDISNIGGKQAVGAMVRFTAGLPRRSEYRKFRIKSVHVIDDYSMIREVVRRRYSGLIKKRKSMPDVVLIDGGKGHLSVAADELKKLGLDKIAVAGIAKEFNHLYTLGRKQPIRLSPGSRLLLLIQRIRDEAHRAAVTYHRNLRSVETFNTELRKIKGVGPVRERMLLLSFGGMSGIRNASVREIETRGVDKKTAARIVKHLRR